MLCASAYPADRRGTELAIEQAAMTMEVAVLAAAERGLATCWMAGISHPRVESVRRLPDGAVLIAMSPLGRPNTRGGPSWDAASRRLISRGRRPLADLWYAEEWR